ncbi:MAG: J domain-containing protein [Bacteroidetes bacterium]|nr:J domain-containing protein [Bacteroidota bacterium]
MNAAPRDPYSVLGIPRDATAAAIREAYRRQVKRAHPDHDPSPQAAQRFMEIHEAYALLRDPLLRLAHDARSRRPSRPDARHPGRPAQRPVNAPAEAPDLDTRSWAFIGLHLTGLVFGVVLVLGILVGITFADWPWAAIVFILPGLVLIPDAWEGLRM